jgi:hypothetical protein
MAAATTTATRRLARLGEHTMTTDAASAGATGTLDMYGNAWRLGESGGIELQRLAENKCCTGHEHIVTLALTLAE